MRHAATLLLILAAALRLHAQAYETRMERGARADLLGKTILASKQYEAAIAVAKTSADRNEARFAYLSAIAGSQPPGEMPEDVRTEVVATYEAIIAEAAGLQSFKAHNDYGVFLLAMKQPKKAVEVFRAGQTSFSEVPPGTQARYLYNFAEALYDAGDFAAALATTRRVIELEPTLEPAASKACKIIASLPKEQCAAEVSSIAELLLEREQEVGAGEWLWKALDPAHLGWFETPPAMARLIALCARWAADSDVGYDKFMGKWLPRLEAAAKGVSPETVEKVEQLALIFRGEGLPLSFDRDPEAIFTRWATVEEKKTLSRLAMIAADAYVDQENGLGAAERYIAAWNLDRTNAEALIYVAAILTDWPDAPVDLLDRMLNEAFERGGAAIADADARLRLHLILGEYFEEQEQWGPHGAPNTAVYHYERALGAYAELFADEPEAVFPGVYASLANAYEHLDMDRPAWQQYLYAAEASLSQMDIATARTMLMQADQQEYGPDASEAERYRKAREALAATEIGSPSDAAVAEEVRARLWAHPELVAEDLAVTVSDGVVSVSGSFDDRYLIEEALIAAKEAAGVKDVRVEVKEAPPQ